MVSSPHKAAAHNGVVPSEEEGGGAQHASHVSQPLTRVTSTVYGVPLPGVSMFAPSLRRRSTCSVAPPQKQHSIATQAANKVSEVCMTGGIIAPCTYNLKLPIGSRFCYRCRCCPCCVTKRHVCHPCCCKRCHNKAVSVCIGVCLIVKVRTNCRCANSCRGERDREMSTST